MGIEKKYLSSKKNSDGSKLAKIRKDCIYIKDNLSARENNSSLIENNSSVIENNLSTYDSLKYDRQIRLFGDTVQNLLTTIEIKISGTSGLIAAEILKNLVLLGVRHISVSNEIIKETKRLVPDNLELINRNFTVTNGTDASVIFAIDDECSTDHFGTYFICSKCLSFRKVPKHSEKNCNAKNISNRFVYECLLGAIVVQEFVKGLEGKETCEEYFLEF